MALKERRFEIAVVFGSAVCKPPLLVCSARVQFRHPAAASAFAEEAFDDSNLFRIVFPHSLITDHQPSLRYSERVREQAARQAIHRPSRNFVLVVSLVVW